MLTKCNLFRGYGEIGKHAGFKIQCRKASRFKSEYPHQPQKNIQAYELILAGNPVFKNIFRKSATIIIFLNLVRGKNKAIFQLLVVSLKIAISV